MQKILISLCCMLFFSAAQAQLNGIVLGSDKKNKKPIYGAKVKLLQAKRGAVTDEEGKFELILPKELPDTIVFSALGYYSDTIVVDKKDRFINLEVVLYSDQILPEVYVTIKKGTHTISRLKTLQVEELTSGELRKAACCNLSESFETNASVDVNITDAVSGAKKIQMMGLDGVYTQIQMENIPYLRGLESSFGLNSIPGTWIESIQITKGTGNVVNGYESMAGLVNLHLKQAESEEAFFFNTYVNGMGRSEVNFNTSFALDTSDRWHSAWAVHGAIHPLEMDYNNDQFRDMPNGNIVSVLNRYQYEGEKMESRFGFNAYLDDKIGGQITSLREGKFYDVRMKSQHIDGFAKMGIFGKKPYNSLGLVSNFKYQKVNARFGDRKFKGEETRGYFNAIYDGIFGTTINKYKVGASFVYSDINQEMDSLNDDRLEMIPGVFGEYTYTGTRFSLILGARADYHNLYDFQFVPRMHSKYALSEYTDLRFTVGKGWRVPNYMIDNVSLLATSREWVAPTEVKPEESWNIGGSVVHEFKIFGNKSSLVVDFYHTTFENQMIVDRDQSVDQIIFTNLSGTSYSNSLQAEFSFSPARNLDFRFAYKYLDVKAEFGGQVQQKVMVPNHRGFFNVGYKTRNKFWEYDLTCSVFGESRLPVNLMPDSTLTTDNMSEVYPMLSAQITRNHKRWEFYLGGENLLKYTQEDPIIDAENPFSSTFDATRVWAPVYGVNIYAGVRFTIKKKEEE